MGTEVELLMCTHLCRRCGWLREKESWMDLPMVPVLLRPLARSFKELHPLVLGLVAAEKRETEGS